MRRRRGSPQVPGVLTSSATSAPYLLKGTTDPRDLVERRDILTRIVTHEAGVIAAVRSNLRLRVAGRWHESDDELFGPHTVFVQFAHQHGLGLRAANVWLLLQKDVLAADRALPKPVHRGAPLFNTGLCYFVSGDFDRAVQFITEAGEADRRDGRGESRIRTGGGFARQILIEPLVAWLHTCFGADFTCATGVTLSATTLDALVLFLESRVADAAVFLGALHRLMSQARDPSNAAARLHRVRALADLLMVLESSLERWQGGVGLTLHGRCCRLVSNTALGTLFAARDGAYAAFHLSPTVNRMTIQETADFDAATTVADRAAIALYHSYRLRNALFHRLDDTLAVHLAWRYQRRAVAFALVAIELSRLGEARASGEPHHIGTL